MGAIMIVGGMPGGSATKDETIQILADSFMPRFRGVGAAAGLHFFKVLWKKKGFFRKRRPKIWLRR
jgi:hypothetical protein